MLFESFGPPTLVERSVEENGALEVLQVVILCLGMVAAIAKLCRLDVRKYPFLALWLGAALLGCIYIAGEEISWGQWIFHWGTPEEWGKLNNQNETNLHNISSWFDQKPRILIEVGIVFSGLVLPFLRRRKKDYLPGWLMPLIPASQAVFLALMYVFVKLCDRFDKLFGTIIFARGSEVIEFFIYYYIMSYIVSFDIQPFSREAGQ